MKEKIFNGSAGLPDIYKTEFGNVLLTISSKMTSNFAITYFKLCNFNLCNLKLNNFELSKSSLARGGAMGHLHPKTKLLCTRNNGSFCLLFKIIKF